MGIFNVAPPCIVDNIQCAFASGDSSNGENFTARLKRPSGFNGTPILADKRIGNVYNKKNCVIERDSKDISENTYFLAVTDFSRCGVIKRNGFLQVRIWFPQFAGVVMQSDQEVIIMCKPPQPIVIENKAAGFAGSFPNGARVSGVVEETPSRLEYEVALYKESPSVANINGINPAIVTPKDPLQTSEFPVDQAVPIGTKLHLRARISAKSAWKFVKLVEVTVSPEPDSSHGKGAIWLVRDGCRNNDFITIIPHQPAKYRDRPNEVFLDFEAFLLSSMRERATLWIHSQIKACMESADCAPNFCMDVYEPSGQGRRRRRRILNSTSYKPQKFMKTNSSEYTRFKENIEYTVIAGELQSQLYIKESLKCHGALSASAVLVVFLAICLGFTCFVNALMDNKQNLKLRLYSSGSNLGYAGRAVIN